jgi:hypothetical protein
MDEMLTRFSLVSIDGCLLVLPSWPRRFVDHRRTAPPRVSRLLWDVLQRFGYMKKPNYHSHVFCEFQFGRCEVSVDIALNAKQPSWMA